MRQRIDARIRTVGIAAFVALTVFNGGAIAANLNVTVDNIKKPKGKIVIALFDSKDSFLVEPVAEFSLDISEDGEAVAGFPDLARGSTGCRRRCNWRPELMPSLRIMIKMMTAN